MSVSVGHVPWSCCQAADRWVRCAWCSCYTIYYEGVFFVLLTRIARPLGAFSLGMVPLAVCTDMCEFAPSPEGAGRWSSFAVKEAAHRPLRWYGLDRGMGCDWLLEPKGVLQLWALRCGVVCAEALFAGGQVSCLPCEGQGEQGAVYPSPGQGLHCSRLAPEIAVVRQPTQAFEALVALDDQGLVRHEVGHECGVVGRQN